MVSWKAGRFSTAKWKVVRLVSASSRLAFSKTSSSYSSRTKALTARMAVRFSWMAALTLSMQTCSFPYRGATLRTMKNRMQARTGVQITNTRARAAFIQKARKSPMMSITGPRTMGRMPPVMAFCMTVMSVVMRVIREEVLKWSRLAKE